MQLDVRWDGSNIPFEGDRSVPLTGIPAGAQVLAARVVVTPVDPGRHTADPEDSFVERIRFAGAGPRWGANIAHGANFVEVDFRARRTLASVTVDDIALSLGHGASLQIDPGGTYVEINEAGAIRTPGDDLFEFMTNGTHVLPSFVVVRFKITNPSNVEPDITEVAIRSVPENVSLRLGDQPAFHTFLGSVTEPETSIDFAVLLNEFLLTAPVVNGQHVVPLLVHSDSIARLDVTVTLDLLLAHQPLTPGVDEAVMDFEVDAMPVGAATSFSVSLPLDAQAVPGRTAVRFQGAFDDTRVAFGPLAPEVTDAAVELVSLARATPAPQAQAQMFTLPDSLNITGIDLLLKPTTPAARVQVDIRDDLGGKPGRQSLLAAPLAFDLRQTPASAPEWLTVDLPVPLHLDEGRPLWLVVQPLLGNAAWSVRAAAVSGARLEMTDDGALSWHKTPVEGLTAAEALFRLRHRPAAFTMPIHVFVGEGDDQQEVPLTSFEPLGRVDFTLDTEAFAAAINDVLATSQGRACQPVEHLVNGDLEEWLREGDRPQAPQGMQWPNGSSPLAIALSPDALYFYVLEFGESGLAIRVFDAFCRTPGATIPLSGLTSDDGEGSVAVSPNGSRLYASFGQQLWAVDLRAQAELGHWEDERQVVALACGGNTLLLARTESSTDAPDIRAIDASAIQTHLDAGTIPPDRLFVQLTTLPASLAMSAGGDRAVAAFGESVSGVPGGALVVYNAAAREQFRVALDFRPGGIAMSSRSDRVLVGNRTGDVLHFADLGRRTVDAGLPAGIDTRSVSLAAISGDRAAVLGFGDNEQMFVRVFDFGTPEPRHWEILGGVVAPVCLGEPFHIGARLGRASEEVATDLSAFSQVVAVTGGCAYEFSFWGSATSDGAAGEVLWRGGRCTGIQTDTVPIRVPESSFSNQASRTLTLHRVRLQAPADATQAEVRFRAADGVGAIVDLASLKPPGGPLGNGDLQVRDEAGAPLGWTLEPAGTPTFSLVGTVAANLGIDPLTLFQEIPVTEGEAFRLEFRGEVRFEVDPPVVAVHWLDVDAAPLELTLDMEAAGVRIADGGVPSGATRAEVSITLTGGSELRITHLAMRTGLLTGVLFSVFAEAPGSLTVSRFQVVTDTATPTPPPPPEDGLCPTTPPGDECGDEHGGARYCPSCRSTQPMRNGRASVLDGRPVRLVTCERCDAMLLRSGGYVHATRRAISLPGLAIARRPLPGSLRPGTRAASIVASVTNHTPVNTHRASPLAVIRGISKAEIAILSRGGPMPLADFVVLDTTALAGLLPSKSVSRARMLQGLARKALEGQDA